MDSPRCRLEEHPPSGFKTNLVLLPTNIHGLEDVHIRLYRDILHFASSYLRQLLLLPLSCPIDSHRAFELELKSRKSSQFEVPDLSEDELPPIKQRR
ncbi:hypothetical protein DNTS_020513 [Danionella cerebrum]|uniref:Uncharacterized protein n=1 Tax=Danionella cerebrum TaxID=2873325 RepID=A0A553P975_9TELE|nr:hypothetical protein DNTS_020513 [Danionella translucida]